MTFTNYVKRPGRIRAGPVSFEADWTAYGLSRLEFSGKLGAPGTQVFSLKLVADKPCSITIYRDGMKFMSGKGLIDAVIYGSRVVGEIQWTGRVVLHAR